MTAPVSLPARPRAPGHTLRLDAAPPPPPPSARQAATRSGPGADMLSAGHLCLLTVLGLILPTRGQKLEETTYASPVDPATGSTEVLTQVSDHPELQSTPQTSVDPAHVPPTPSFGLTDPNQSSLDREIHTDTTASHVETHTRHPTTAGALAVTDPGAHARDQEGTTTRSEKWFPRKDVRMMDPQTPKPPGSSEDDPFYYDEATLRKRGLLVAAVLFITGIVILTSGKCRQLSRLCRNRPR
ncbi:FXYD domain-containing ion transport regulator 5 [Oryctolagus cuniculus]|uniref:FXYD domain-containing ion transport regulator 5 n=1 Tax=Oryctolagus cuniculus TaxID=9986 RepID=UPI0038793EEF